MASVRCTDVQARPTAFLDVTSVTRDEFQQLVPPVETVFQGLCRKFCSGSHEGAVAPVEVGITRPESRTIRPQ